MNLNWVTVQSTRGEHFDRQRIKFERLCRPIIHMQVKLVTFVATATPSSISVWTTARAVNRLAIFAEPCARRTSHGGFAFCKGAIRTRPEIQQQITASRGATDQHLDALLGTFKALFAAIGPALPDMYAGLPVPFNVHRTNTTFRSVVIAQSHQLDFRRRRSAVLRCCGTTKLSRTVIHQQVRL